MCPERVAERRTLRLGQPTCCDLGGDVRRDCGSQSRARLCTDVCPGLRRIREYPRRDERGRDGAAAALLCPGTEVERQLAIHTETLVADLECVVEGRVQWLEVEHLRVRNGCEAEAAHGTHLRVRRRGRRELCGYRPAERLSERSNLRRRETELAEASEGRRVPLGQRSRKHRLPEADECWQRRRGTGRNHRRAVGDKRRSHTEVAKTTCPRARTVEGHANLRTVARCNHVVRGVAQLQRRESRIGTKTGDVEVGGQVQEEREIRRRVERPVECETH